MDDVVLTDRSHPEITILRLNRPERMNALDENLIGVIYRSLSTIAEDATQRVVIITGVGNAFCAGLDIKASVRWREKPQSVVARFARQELFAGMIKRIRELKQPVIAAVNGPAAGAGLGLALAADIRIASPLARFMIASIRLGITAGECGISYFLPRLIGASRASEVMLTGRPIEAEEAAHIGLVSRLMPADELMSGAVEIAHAILANSPFGVTQTKKIMWTNLEAPSLDAALDLENRAQLVTLYSDDFAEATRAFVEKRKAVFKGC
jgi:enoyl-CoA hydratase